MSFWAGFSSQRMCAQGARSHESRAMLSKPWRNPEPSITRAMSLAGSIDARGVDRGCSGLGFRVGAMKAVKGIASAG